MKRLMTCVTALTAVGYAGVGALDADQGTASTLPAFAQWSTLCEGVEHTTSIAIGDLDADGDLDLVSGNGRHLPERDWVWSNNGRGVFYGKRSVGSEADPTYAVALGDLDGNGSLDLVVANDTGHASLAYRNDGHGHFTPLGPLGRARQPRRAVALGDFDGDRDLDAVLVGLGQDHLYLNDGTGRGWTERAFGRRETGALPRATGVATGDIDGDGDIDIVVPGRYEAKSLIYFNDGQSGFAQSKEFGAAADDMTTVALADLDGDKRLDIITGNWKQPHRVYLNDGGESFTRTKTFGGGDEQTWSLAVADMDLDGDHDVVVGNANIAFWGIDLDQNGLDPRDSYGNAALNAPSRLYVNDGRGGLSPGPAISAGHDNTRPVAVGDLDRDGDPDVVLGNDCQSSHIFWNPTRGSKAEALQ